MVCGDPASSELSSQGSSAPVSGPVPWIFWWSKISKATKLDRLKDVLTFLADLTRLYRAHAADEVFVTGTFDDWGKTVKLEKIGDVFEKEVDLPEADGKVHYKVSSSETPLFPASPGQKQSPPAVITRVCPTVQRTTFHA